MTKAVSEAAVNVAANIAKGLMDSAGKRQVRPLSSAPGPHRSGSTVALGEDVDATLKDMVANSLGQDITGVEVRRKAEGGGSLLILRVRGESVAVNVTDQELLLDHSTTLRRIRRAVDAHKELNKQGPIGEGESLSALRRVLSAGQGFGLPFRQEAVQAFADELFDIPMEDRAYRLEHYLESKKLQKVRDLIKAARDIKAEVDCTEGEVVAFVNELESSEQRYVALSPGETMAKVVTE